MDPAAAWVPSYDFQLASWTMEPAVRAPGFSEEFASIETFGNCLQTYVPSSAGGRLIEYAAATHEDSIVKLAQEFQVHSCDIETKTHRPIQVFKGAADRFEIDVDKPDKKIHRYPPSIRALDRRYTTPTMVAIGPYHHGQDRLNPVEHVKHAAAYHCIRESGYSVQQMYNAVVSAAYDCQACNLYEKEAMAGISHNEDFLPMMFLDTCFLVQYMLTCTNWRDHMDPTLLVFFDSNDIHIFHDLMLLENQIPWPVVEAIMSFRQVTMKEVVATLKSCLQDNKVVGEEVPFDEGYKPPRFLGLLRYYIVGRSKAKLGKLPETTEPISFSASAVELAEVGIKIAANKTTDLSHMGAKKNGPIFGKLYMAPLSLDEGRATYLIKMAALKLCTTPNFQDAEDEASGVCSYLLLLAMMVDRVEDVHELRSKHILQGGGGLTDNEVVAFLGSLQNLRLGSSNVRTMEEIKGYKYDRRMWTKLYAFVYRNWKIISVIFSIIGGFISLIVTIVFKVRLSG